MAGQDSVYITIPFICIGLCLIVFELKTQRIPDAIIILALLYFFGVHVLIDPDQIRDYISSSICVPVFLFGLQISYRRKDRSELIGQGLVKSLVVAAAAFGSPVSLIMLLLFLLIGFLYGFILKLSRGRGGREVPGSLIAFACTICAVLILTLL